jgi:hypothetical protein
MPKYSYNNVFNIEPFWAIRADHLSQVRGVGRLHLVMFLVCPRPIKLLLAAIVVMGAVMQ